MTTCPVTWSACSKSLNFHFFIAQVGLGLKVFCSMDLIYFQIDFSWFIVFLLVFLSNLELVTLHKVLTTPFSSLMSNETENVSFVGSSSPYYSCILQYVIQLPSWSNSNGGFSVWGSEVSEAFLQCVMLILTLKFLQPFVVLEAGVLTNRGSCTWWYGRFMGYE